VKSKVNIFATVHESVLRIQIRWDPDLSGRIRILAFRIGSASTKIDILRERGELPNTIGIQNGGQYWHDVQVDYIRRLGLC
jgi:hypothetical protein